MVAQLGMKFRGLSRNQRLKRLQKTIEVLLAPQLTLNQIARLMNEVRDPRMAVVLALMLPSGSRFADVARMVPSDFVRWNPLTGLADIRVHQQKNIRKRLHQRWVSQNVPLALAKYLTMRLALGRSSNVPLVEVGYWEFLDFLKKFLGDRSVSTYSVRRTVFEMMRRRCRTIEDMMKATLHFNADMLRWYLELPMEDDRRIQVHATSWHVNLRTQK